MQDRNSAAVTSPKVFPTMITPFTAENAVDYDGVDALVEWYWKNGCDGIFAVCQSSEMFFLSLEERVAIARRVVRRARELARSSGRPPMTIVVSGHISETKQDQREELAAMSQTGADALILLTNRFDGSSDEAWAEGLCEAVSWLPPDLPLGLYECPKPYKQLLSEGMLAACAQTGRFAFIKDTCCDGALIGRRLELLRGTDIALYNANAQTRLQTLRQGCAGYCGVMANFHPDLYVRLCQNFNSDSARVLQSFLALAAFAEGLTYPAAAKYYLSAFEGLPLRINSRSVDAALLTDYQKSILSQMRTLEMHLRKTSELQS